MERGKDGIKQEKYQNLGGKKNNVTKNQTKFRGSKGNSGTESGQFSLKKYVLTKYTLYTFVKALCGYLNQTSLLF